MRPMIVVVAVLVTVVLIADAQERKAKDGPTDEAVINRVGGRLAKMFTQFGTPEAIEAVCWGDGSGVPFAMLHYPSAVAFGVHQKTVGICYFFPGWKGTIKGIKIGDSREQVIKILGDEFENSDEKNDEGVDDCKWDLKDNDAWLWVIFDKNNLAKRVHVQLK